MDKIRVFISYSHENEIWLAEWLDPVLQTVNPRCLLRQWQRTFRNENVEFWFDREPDKGLRGGERWRDRIFEEIDRDDIAVLLVTLQFVSSPFIKDQELPRILARHKKGEMEVLPLLVQPTRLKDLPTGDFLQWAPGKPTPLSSYFDRGENAFAEACNEVLDALEGTITRAREKRNPPVRTQPTEKKQPVIEESRGHEESAYKLPQTLEELERRLFNNNAKNEKDATQPPLQLPHGPSVRIATVAGLSLTMEALLGVVSSTTEVPHTFNPLLQVPASAELLQLARQLYNDVSFRRLSPGERGIINSRMQTIIRSMGGALKEVVETIPEADYLMALVFMLDMERISKMGSMLEQVERDAVLYAFPGIPGKIEEYLTKYLRRAPDGMFAERARELLNAVAIPEREALIRDIPILAKRTLSSSSYTCTFRLDPDQEGIFVRVETFFLNQPAPNGTQTFRLPGSHTFSASEDSVSIMIASKGLINLGRYDRATASALAHALSRLNALLAGEKADKPDSTILPPPKKEDSSVERFSASASQTSAKNETASTKLAPRGVFSSEKTPGAQELKIIVNEKDGTQLILIPEGEFLAGGPGKDQGGCPPFPVNLPAFYLAMYPVTNEQYARFLTEVKPELKHTTKWIWLDQGCFIRKSASGYEPYGGKDQHPVINVTWNGADAYCRWSGLRLPTELEWEKGARGTDGREFPWGQEWDRNKCRNSSNNGDETTCSVESYPEGRSPWGLYQMSGNVWEWCTDLYDSSAYDRYWKGDLSTPQGSHRVLRGCSWLGGDYGPYFCCAVRSRGDPGLRSNLVGFRCAKTP